MNLFLNVNIDTNNVKEEFKVVSKRIKAYAKHIRKNNKMCKKRINKRSIVKRLGKLMKYEVKI